MKKNKIFIHIIMVILSIVCLLPFVLVISTSLMGEQEFFQYGYAFFPRKIDFTAYQYILANPKQIVQSYGITIISTLIGTVLSVILMLLIAYPISRRDFRYKKTINFMVLITLLFSGGMSPTYILVTQYLHLTDTIWALILPTLIAPFYIFLLRSFCANIPTSLIESAKIDGANEYYILYKIIIPLSTPSIATVTFFMVLGKWNDWLNGLLYIRTDALLPLQTLLQRIMSEITVLTTNLQNMPAGLAQTAKVPQNTVLMAMAVLATGPMLFAFPFFQKYFVGGLTVGAIKG